MKDIDQTRYTLTEHLTELRARLLVAVLAILVTTIAALAFAADLLDVAVEPLRAVLRDKNRVETILVHPDGARAQYLVAQLGGSPNVRFRGVVDSLEALRPKAVQAVSEKSPIDLVMISRAAIDADGTLADEILEGIDPAPFVAYLVTNPREPIVSDLMLEGANVLMDPPRKAAVARTVRRAAASAGKLSHDDKLVVLSPIDPFIAYLKIAFVVGLFCACPIWLWQAWRFVAPGLYSHEKAFAGPVIGSATILFVGGGLFAYFILFPIMFDFLVNQMMPAALTTSFTVDKYLSLLLWMTLLFGVVFETPLAIAMLSAIGIVTPQGLRKNRKYAIVAAFVIGAVLTPADPISQSIMAVPLIIFYEVGILAASFLAKKRESVALTQTQG